MRLTQHIPSSGMCWEELWGYLLSSAPRLKHQDATLQASIVARAHCYNSGVILRDSRGIAQVKALTGTKILRILKAKGKFSN